MYPQSLRVRCGGRRRRGGDEVEDPLVGNLAATSAANLGTQGFFVRLLGWGIVRTTPGAGNPNKIPIDFLAEDCVQTRDRVARGQHRNDPLVETNEREDTRMKQSGKPLGTVIVLTALLFIASRSSAADSTEVQWDHVFPGHEMWLTSLDSGLAVSAKESRPMLVDFYSRH